MVKAATNLIIPCLPCKFLTIVNKIILISSFADQMRLLVLWMTWTKVYFKEIGSPRILISALQGKKIKIKVIPR